MTSIFKGSIPYSFYDVALGVLTYSYDSIGRIQAVFTFDMIEASVDKREKLRMGLKNQNRESSTTFLHRRLFIASR